MLNFYECDETNVFSRLWYNIMISMVDVVREC